MSPYFSRQPSGEPFVPYSLSHVGVLVLFAAAIFALYRARQNIRAPLANGLIRYSLAGFLLLSEVAVQSWQILTENWTLAYSLPLQLCSISLLLSVIMLLTYSYRVYEITYFLGLGGASQAMLTPDLLYPYPHFIFFIFFLAHAAIILACLFMTWVEEYRPTLRSMWKAFGFLNLLLPFVLWVNHVTGGNYMFISRKPLHPSLLDYLGPYPWYILSLEGVAILLFLLLYLPHRLRKKNLHKPTQTDAAL